MRKYRFLLAILLFWLVVQMVHAKSLNDVICEQSPTSATELKALIDAGADVNLIEGEDGWPPILCAAKFAKDPEIIDILCNHGVNLNSATDEDGRNALLLAAANNPELAIIKKLIEKGMHLMAKDGYNDNALILAAKYNENPEVIKFFLNSPLIDVNEKNTSGLTALSGVLLDSFAIRVKENAREVLQKCIATDRRETVRQLVKTMEEAYKSKRDADVLAILEKLDLPEAGQILAHSLKANNFQYAAEQIVKHYESPSTPASTPSPTDSVLEAILTTASDHYQENGFKEFIFGQSAEGFQFEKPRSDGLCDLIGTFKDYGLGFRDRNLVYVLRTYRPVADYTSAIKTTFGEITKIISGHCKNFGSDFSFLYGKQIYQNAVLVTEHIETKWQDGISICIFSKPFIREILYKLSPDLNMHLKIFKDIIVERQSKPFVSLAQDNRLPLPDSARLKGYLNKTYSGFSLSVLKANKDSSSNPGISFDQELSKETVSGYKGYLSLGQSLDAPNSELLSLIMDHRFFKPIFAIYFAGLAMKYFPPEGGNYQTSTDGTSTSFSYKWVCNSIGTITVTDSTVVISSVGKGKEL